MMKRLVLMLSLITLAGIWGDMRSVQASSTLNGALSFHLPSDSLLPQRQVPRAKTRQSGPSRVAQSIPKPAVQRNSAIAAPNTPDIAHIAKRDPFVGGAKSLVARAVGSAEGTRRPDGGTNPAYYGHIDPGNRQWNLGSFSYQHGARSPQEADQRQLERLARQDQQLQQRADALGLTWGLNERLNGIDLANQSPLAALDRRGYVDRLSSAYSQGFRGLDAVLEARVNAFRHPDNDLWDAPGLGNNEPQIRRDQARRMSEIAAAIAWEVNMTLHAMR